MFTDGKLIGVLLPEGFGGHDLNIDGRGLGLGRAIEHNVRRELTAMHISLEVPEDIVASVGPDRESVERVVLEGLALEGVRSGRLSRGQVRRLLGFESRYAVDGFLKGHGVPIEENLEDIRKASELVLGRGNG